jgi:hypothetical protein
MMILQRRMLRKLNTHCGDCGSGVSAQRSTLLNIQPRRIKGPEFRNVVATKINQELFRIRVTRVAALGYISIMKHGRIFVRLPVVMFF